MYALYLLIITLGILGFQNCAEKGLDLRAAQQPSGSENQQEEQQEEEPPIKPPAKPAIQFSSRGVHACYVKDGAMKCWGSNLIGEIGIGNTENQNRPQNVIGMESGVTQVATGNHSTCAINNGALYCWGYNRYGQLGIGTFTADAPNAAPLQVRNMESGVSKIVAGAGVTCAIKNGGLYCWGYNNFGNLGINSTSDQNIPVAVDGMDSGVTDVSISQYNAYGVCAVKDSALYCWGQNEHGQVGDGTNQNRYAPVLVSGMDSGVTSVGVGNGNACAVKDGAVYCWGHNFYGSLGLGHFDNRNSPTRVNALDGKNITKLSVGGAHSCVLAEGSVYCWGHNSNGQVGVGSLNNTPLPTKIVGLDGATDVTAAAVQGGDWGATSYAIKNDRLYVWGSNGWGQFGNASSAQQVTAPMASFSF